MPYKSVYYDDIGRINNVTSKEIKKWFEDLRIINENIDNISNSTKLKGQAAESIKNYLSQVHGVLSAIIASVLNTYMHQLTSYYTEYKSYVDCGRGDNSGIDKTTIIFDEVNNGGIIKNEIKKLIDMSNQVASDAINVKNSISDLVYISANPRNTALVFQLEYALGKAVSVNDRVIEFENSRVNDLVEIDRLISQAQSIIDNQLGNRRISIIDYQNGAIGTMCDIDSVFEDLKTAEDIVQKFMESDGYEEAMNYALNRDKIIAAEEREWIKWVAVGITVVGSIAFIVATAGAASPGVCAAVGFVSGGFSKAAEELADNYIKNGSLTEGMDWSSFGKDVLISAAVNGVSGYLGAVSTGSAIKQPIEKAISSAGIKAAEKATGGLIGMGWDVGEAIWNKKPGGEILSILEQDTEKMLKDITVEGAKAFVGGYVSQKFDIGNIDTSEKGHLKKIGENAVENIAKELTGGALNTAWDVGEAALDPDSSKTMKSILSDNIEKTVSQIGGSVTDGIVSEAFSFSDDIDSKTGKIIMKSIGGTLSDTSENVVKGMTRRTIKYGFGDERIVDDIWEEDLDKGRKVLKAAGDSAGKNITEEVREEKIFNNKLKKSDYDKDGKIELVQFDEYAVKKEDYDAAVKNAGKGAYKDKTVQDILGLPKDTDLKSANIRTESIDMLEKYKNPRKTTDTVTVDGKYTYKKSYYDSVTNVTSQEGYNGKAAQDMLDMPEDVDISKENITTKRVSNDEIGYGKKYEFTKDSGTNVTKIHVSSMKHETKLKREELKKQRKEILEG